MSDEKGIIPEKKKKRIKTVSLTILAGVSR